MVQMLRLKLRSWQLLDIAQHGPTCGGYQIRPPRSPSPWGGGAPAGNVRITAERLRMVASTTLLLAREAPGLVSQRPTNRWFAQLAQQVHSTVAGSTARGISQHAGNSGC